MRISDWSSDVCSSDLRPAGTGKSPMPMSSETRKRKFRVRQSSPRQFSLRALSLHAPSRASLAVLLLLAAAAPLLSGCIGIAVGGAAAGGVAAAEERGIKTAGNDKGIPPLIANQYVKPYRSNEHRLGKECFST